MKTLLLVSTLLQLAVGSLAAASLSIVASDEWTPFDFPGLADLVKRQNGVVIDASRSASHNLFVHTVEFPLVPVSAKSASEVLVGMEKAVTGSGGEIVGTERQSLFGLPGYSVTSRVGEVHGRTYVLFTSDHVVTVTMQRAGLIATDDAGVASYVERVQLAPGVLPGAIGEIDRSSPAFRVGYLIGKSLLPVLAFGCLAVGLGIAFRLRKGRKKAAQPGATDNPDDAQRLRGDH